MSNYIRDIEEQNEDLRRRLAVAEAKAVDRDTYSNVIKKILQNAGFSENNIEDGVTFVAIKGTDTLISSRDIGQDCMKSLIDIMHEIKNERKLKSTYLMREAAESFGKMTVDTGK